MLHHEHRIAVRGVKHRGGRNGKYIEPGRHDDGHVGKHPRPQTLIRVGNGRLDADVARGSVHFRVDGSDASFDRLAGDRIGGHSHGHPFADLGQLLLGKQKIGENRVQGLEGDDVLTVFEELPQADQTDAQSACERCPDGFFIDRCADVVPTGHRLLVLGFVGVELGLRDDVIRNELTGTIQVDTGEVDSGFGCPQLRGFRGNVLLNEKITGLYPRAGLKCDVYDLSRQFGGDHHPLHRL